MNIRKDRAENVQIFLGLREGESAYFPLNMYNVLRGLRYTNPEILTARGEGHDWQVRSDIANKRVVLTRLK